MPEYVVNRLTDILNQREKPLKNSQILLVGVAYKGDIDDLRESPALKIWDILEKKEAKVMYHDPYCPKIVRGGKTFYSEELTAELVRSSDIALIVAGHKNKIDYKLIVDNAAIVFDTKNIISKTLGVSAYKYDNIALL